MLDPKFVRRGLFLVFMILFLDVIGIAIIMPVLPAYLEELTGGSVSDAALDGGWLLVVYAVALIERDGIALVVAWIASLAVAIAILSLGSAAFDAIRGWF